MVSYTTTLSTLIPSDVPQVNAGAQALALLSHASPEAPGRLLPEHEVLVVSDVTNGLRDVLHATKSKEGMEWLEKEVGRIVAVKLRRFWEEELLEY